MQAIARIWERFFFVGGSAERLGFTRIVLGIGMIPFHIQQFGVLLTFDLYGPSFYFVDPIWYFDHLGIEALNPVACVVVFGVLMLSTAGFAAGFYTRTSLVVMLVSILYLKGMRDSVDGDIHHRYVIPFTVLGFFLLSRCGEIFSRDATRAQGRGESTAISEWEATWPIRAGQVYVCSFYFWSGIAKVRMSGMGWIEDGTRMQDLLLLRSVRYGYENGVAIDGSQIALAAAHSVTLNQFAGGVTYVFELAFPLILLIRDARLRLLFFLGVAFFHIANYVLINVQFLFLPIIFVLFFDISGPLSRWLERRGYPISGPSQA